MYLNRLSLDVFILDYEASLGEKKFCLQSYPPDLCILYSAAVAV